VTSLHRARRQQGWWVRERLSKLKKAKRDGALAGDVEAVPDNREHLSFVHGPDCGMYWDQLLWCPPLAEKPRNGRHDSESIGWEERCCNYWAPSSSPYASGVNRGHILLGYSPTLRLRFACRMGRKRCSIVRSFAYANWSRAGRCRSDSGPFTHAKKTTGSCEVAHQQTRRVRPHRIPKPPPVTIL